MIKKYLLALILIITISSGVFSQDKINVYFYDKIISKKDVLRDGKYKVLPVQDNTMLIWVNHWYSPSFLGQKNSYILITKNNVNVIHGEYWPTINGKKILFLKKKTITSPVKLKSSFSESLLANIYIYPDQLNSKDVLIDLENKIELSNNTLLIWVDHFPKADFAHESTYILIKSPMIQLVYGKWWPKLNTKNICLDQLSDPINIESPYELIIK